MKKRKPSYFMMAHTRRMRREYLNRKRKEKRKEGKKQAQLEKTNPLKAIGEYHDNSKDGELISSEDRKNLKKIPCPENVCLDSNIDETINFLNLLPGATSPNRQARRLKRATNYESPEPKRYYDFASIKKICPASALIISSHYFMYKSRGDKINVFDWPLWNAKVKNTLRKMGFFELLKFKPISTDGNLQEIPIKGFRSGNEAAAEEITEYFHKLVRKIDEHFYIDKEDESFKKTMAAISEAVENSVRHAYQSYTEKFPADVQGRWWLGGMRSSDAKEVTFVCYDKGISIPKHIKEAGLEEDREEIHELIRFATDTWAKLRGKPDSGGNLDDKRLEFAMEYAMSSTKATGSGRGLSSITRAINEFGGGEVKIMSRRAYASVIRGQQPVFKLLDTPIIGTLIVWKIRLQ